jgi:hypothetical protein
MTRLTPGTIWLACLTTLAALLALAGSDAWWSWLIALAIGVGPWFAAAKLLDERTELQEEIERRDREDEATVPVPLIPFDSLPKVEREFIRPDLHIVPPQRTGEHDDLPEADESWLDETPLFHDVCFKNWEKR